MPRGGSRLRTSNNRTNIVGIRVRERRAFLKITQDALCGRIADVTQTHWVPDRLDVLRIESGRRQVTDLEIIALAQALECSPCWLLIGE
jgi:transcriptional regulator with XRE-family HTH domain